MFIYINQLSVCKISSPFESLTLLKVLRWLMWKFTATHTSIIDFFNIANQGLMEQGMGKAALHLISHYPKHRETFWVTLRIYTNFLILGQNGIMSFQQEITLIKYDSTDLWLCVSIKEAEGKFFFASIVTKFVYYMRNVSPYFWIFVHRFPLNFDYIF